VATVATLTAADVFPACYIGAVIPDSEDLVGRINLLLLLLTFTQRMAVLLHLWLKKTQNTQIGAVQDSINMRIL
jgi:hypothetical protein